MTMDDEKKRVRTQLLTQRAAIPVAAREDIDAALGSRVVALPEFAEADAVFTYLSMGAEVDTRAIIEQAWRANKTVAIPRCIPSTRLMSWHAVTSLDGLVRSTFGIDEPADNDATRLDPASFEHPIALVPGLSFDRNGFRIGYGGGFYDIFLESFTGVSVGLCREMFLVEQDIPHEGHDLPVGLVVTESQIIRL